MKYFKNHNVIRRLNYFFLVALLFLLSCCSAVTETENKDESETIVKKLGQLHVKGNQIVDENNNIAALHGMSLFWSQWGGDFYNEDCINWLYNDWKCSVIRAAMGVESGGYIANPETELTKICTVIDACIKNGIYVIVDWHDHNAQNNLEIAKSFFKIISEKYGDNPNIIYEIYNEPLQVSWSNIIKPYCEEVIKVIRENESDNLIIVGTPTWSQDVDVAAKDPVSDSNTAYALHFYTSTHKQWLRTKAVNAMNSGAALFISEFGTSEANGDGIIDTTEMNLWFNFIKQYNLSTCDWSVFDKDETSAALKPGASHNGNWTESDLSESGKINRNFIRALNQDLFRSIGLSY
jgi:endoglucanase